MGPGAYGSGPHIDEEIKHVFVGLVLLGEPLAWHTLSRIANEGFCLNGLSSRWERWYGDRKAAKVGVQRSP